VVGPRGTGISDSGWEAVPVSASTPLIAALECMMQELCSDDLTLGQAKILRPRLLDLLEALDGHDTKAVRPPFPVPGPCAGSVGRVSRGIPAVPPDSSRAPRRMTCVVQADIEIPTGA
jgi:hypothetical protein